MMPSAGTLSRPGAVEACALARVAGRTVLDNSEQERVAVAIDPRVDHILIVAARVAFDPHLTARPAPVRHAARLERLPERSLVHIRQHQDLDRKSTRLNSSHVAISYAVFCLKKKKNIYNNH